MGQVEKKLAVLYKETTKNNELMEETFKVQKEVTKEMEEAMQAQIRISNEIAKQRLEMGDLGNAYDKEDAILRWSTTAMATIVGGTRSKAR